MPAPTYHGDTTAVTAATDTKLDVAKPTDTAVDDLLIAIIGLQADEAISATTLTWTSLDSQSGGTRRTHVFWRIATASDLLETQYRFSWTSTVHAVGAIARISGHDATTPINIHSKNYDSVDNTSAIATGVTTTVADCLLLYLSHSGVSGGEAAVSYAPPGTMTEEWDTNTGASRSCCGAREVLGAAGDTGDRTATTSAARRNRNFLVAVAPAGGAVSRKKRMMLGVGL